MISLIGNRKIPPPPPLEKGGRGGFLIQAHKKSRRGFTFFEVMVTVAILSTGVVMIYKALLISLDHQQYLTHRLYAMNLLEDKTVSIQRNYQESGNLPLGENEEIHRVMLNNKPMSFYFTMDFSNMGDLEDIFQLDLVLSWRERGRLIHLSRSAYVHRL